MIHRIRYKSFLFMTVALLVLSMSAVTAHGAARSSANYIMERDVAAGAGGDSASTNYSLSNVLGQTSPPGASSSAEYNLYAGYQQPGQVPQLPDISVSPASHDFGSVNVGSSSTGTFTVTNTGDGDLVMGKISITGADASQFSIQNDDFSGETFAPSVTDTVEVTFSPNSEGTKSANLSIPSNDPDTPTVNVALSAAGAAVTSPDDGGGGGSGISCFIATAAFGSYMEPHVKILRDFRDACLLPNRAGQAFVRLYYEYSPPVADFIAEHGGLKAAVRCGLYPLVGLSYVALHTTPAQQAVMMLGLVFALSSAVMVRRRLRRRDL